MGKRASFYLCGGEPERPFTEERCLKTGVAYAEAFQNAAAMVQMALSLKEQAGDSLVKLPFTVTVEAEALGAEVSFDSRYGVPGITGFKYKTLLEIEEIPHIRLDSGTVREVLAAVRILAARGEHVAVNMEGPFTVLSHLVSSKEIYKGLHRRRERLNYLTGRITEELILYAGAIEAAGAGLISFADPVVSCTLVSPDTYREMCGLVTYRCLQGILQGTDHVAGHLCSATSMDFEKAGFCRTTRVQVPEDLNYGQALWHALAKGPGRLFGHGCLQCSSLQLPEPVIYGLQLEAEPGTCDYTQ